MKNRFNRYAWPYALWTVVIIVLPLVVIFVFSFSKNGSFSLEGYGLFFTPLYLKVLLKSLELALKATAICLIVGYPIALLISREEGTRKSTLMLLLMLPMWINFLLKTYAWRPILGNTGLLNSFLEMIGLDKVQFLYTEGAVLLGMVYNFIPFMILPILSVLDKMDHKLIEAAHDLGADDRTVFLKVVLPLSLPGIISGISLVFMPSVSTFIIPIILGGGQDMMIGNLIERQFLKVGNWNFGSSISVILMLVILSAMIILSLFDREKRGER
ncbi:MAG: ABC transporter permease [Spirochaetales bacterium]|nr:ABC transporter permease [Spirochaetales bacterium]